MKLRRLELIGFKSFMDKTVLNFEDGITAVVGPNGCGKSNIVDAIFWVMGDQSAKHLRGGEMQDVIFSGTERHPPSGLSEVTLTFSTEDGGVPPQYSQYSEVTVTRRLYRSGESEYLINKTLCRLKDVAEFFMDTGVGTKAYGIIEQGQIGRIIVQKPEERRSLIEEAAGITKFKSRKREASLKMEGTEQNLLRLNDIITEIKRQIDSLERQARKAEKYKHIKEEIREIELTVISQDFARLSEALKGLDQDLQTQKQSHGEELAERQKTEALLEKLKLHLTTLEKELHASQEALYQTQQQIQETENQIEIKKKEIENWKALELKDKNDQKGLEEKQTQLQKSIQNVSKAIEALVQEEGVLQKTLEAKQLELQSELQKQAVLDRKCEGLQAELVTILTQEVQCRNHIENLKQRQSAFEEEWERLSEEERSLVQEISSLEKRKSQGETSLADVELTQKQLQVQKEAVTADGVQTRELKAQQLLEHEKTKEILQKILAQIHSIQEIEKNFIDEEAGLKVLLSQKNGLLGILADFIEVESGYEKALEGVLEDRLRMLVTENRSQSLKAIEELVTQNAGQATFLSLETSLPESPLCSVHGSLEPLWKKVQIKKLPTVLIQNLLSHVYLVSDLSQALEHWDKKGGCCTFVTPQGEKVSPLGWIRGGRAKEIQKGVLSRRRELKDLEAQKTQLENEMKTQGLRAEELKRREETLEKESESLTQKIHEREVSHTSFTKDVAKDEEDLQRLKEEQEDLILEKEELSSNRQNLSQELSKELSQSSLLEEKKKAKEAALETSQTTRKRVGLDVESRQKEVGSIEIQKATLTEKQNALQRQKDHLDQNVQSFEMESEEKQKAIVLAQEQQKMIEHSIEQKTAQLKQDIENLERCRQSLSSLKGTFDQELERSRVLEEGLKKQHMHFSQVETALHEKELKLSQITMSTQHLKEQVQERYVIDLETIFERYLNREITEEQKQKLVELKERVSRMGEVNLTAISEYEELKQRYDSLESQRTDLLQSLDTLKKTIEKINRITRKRFEETFEVVNENFKKVFPVLFNGGRAELILTDQNNLLETGVDILAKPPGKKLQNINLLSGGEKALTAVSLIFAIFLMKPSPFCLLDEVDAPLDDANVGRFNEMVRKLTAQSQFVMITHNKKTMAMADTLYGVTMETPGVSNIISVKLEKAIHMSQSAKPSQPQISV